MIYFFPKQEYVPSRDEYYTLGLFELNDDSINKNFNKSVSSTRFPIFNYPTFQKSLQISEKDTLVLASTRNRYVVWDNLSFYPCLFLEFADLDLSNKDEVSEFVEKYGFLNVFQKYDNLKLLSDLKNFSTHPHLLEKDGPPLYGESFNVWIRFQLLLRTLIKIWRYLRNKKINRISHKTQKPFYEIDLFEFVKENRLIFCDRQNCLYGLSFMGKKSYKNGNSYFDPDLFNNIKIDTFTHQLDLTENFNDHKVDLNTRLIKPADFIEHFAEEFLKEQLNDALNFFSPTIKLSGYVTFRSELATMSSKINYCDTLGHAIINQFIESILNEDDFIRCFECQKWMSLGRKKGERKNYCSKQCTSQAYERRKKLAASEDIKNFISNFTYDRQKFNIEEIMSFEEIYNVLTIRSDIKNKQLFKSMLKNLIDNFNINARPENVFTHLRIDFEKSINFVKFLTLFTSESIHINTQSYWDWDYKQKLIIYKSFVS